MYANGRRTYAFRVITTPLLLLDLLLTAALPWPTVLYTLLLDEIMIITGLIGALVASSYKVCANLPPPSRFLEDSAASEE